MSPVNDANNEGLLLVSTMVDNDFFRLRHVQPNPPHSDHRGVKEF